MSTINYPSGTLSQISNGESADQSVLNRVPLENKNNYDAIKDKVEKTTFDWNNISNNTNCNSNEGYMLNSTSGSFTCTLPASPLNGDRIAFIDAVSQAGTNNIIIGRNGNSIQGLAENLTVDVNDASFILIYNSTNSDWRIF